MHFLDKAGEVSLLADSMFVSTMIAWLNYFHQNHFLRDLSQDPLTHLKILSCPF